MVRGQMKIQQMAFMLIAVTLFLAMAGLFIFALRFAGLKEGVEALEETNAILLASKIADSPEFSCENAFGTTTSSCIDLDKIIALKSRISSYRDFWGVSGLEIRIISPAGGSAECNSNNYPNCGKITLISADEGTGVSNFVSLCRKEQGDFSYNKCEIGRIIVNYGE